jgi:hypothetical protein
MSPRWVTASSAAVSFVLAAVAGVVGNQLAWDAVWAWVAFGTVLVLGAAVTAWTAQRISVVSGLTNSRRVPDPRGFV